MMAARVRLPKTSPMNRFFEHEVWICSVCSSPRSSVSTKTESEPNWPDVMSNSSPGATGFETTVYAALIDPSLPLPASTLTVPETDPSQLALPP